MLKTVDILWNAIDNFVMCNNEKTQEEFKENVFSGEGGQPAPVLSGQPLTRNNETHQDLTRRLALALPMSLSFTEQHDAIAKIIEELARKHAESIQKPVEIPVIDYPASEYPIGKEKEMLFALRRGEYNEATKILNELMAIVMLSSSGLFKNVQLRAIELAVLISRIEVNPANSEIFHMETNSQSLRQIQEAGSIDEMIIVLRNMAEKVANHIASFRGSPHAAALRKAETFIRLNFTRKLSLKEISSVAGLSPPYFSTIFKEEMGENLSKYLNRLRVEKASRLLLETDMSLNEIAARCCFEDQSWFSKIFKAFAGVSPGKFRNQGG
jgi:AraC-like DNA-binding protein